MSAVVQVRPAPPRFFKTKEGWDNMSICANCGSVTTDIYTDGGWIRVCPVCGPKGKLPPGYREPTQADRLAGMGYAKAQVMEYAEAERLFREAYALSTDDDLRAGYIWWAVKCCYGVEYVDEVLYKDDSQQRKHRYVPIIARLPFNEAAITGCETLSLFRDYWSQHPSLEKQRLLSEMEDLYARTNEVMQQRNNYCDIFIAWHDSGNRQCLEFAEKLEIELARKKNDCFFSARTLNDIHTSQFAEYIYTALATARAFVIVIEDYDALGQGFLAWEIKRMKRRQRMDQSVQILFNGMSGHTGVIPDFMTDLQRHYEDSTLTRDRIELVSMKVINALDRACEAQAASEIIYAESKASEPIHTVKASESTLVTESDFEYILSDNGTVTVTGYHGKATRFTIPDRIADRPVLRIGENAFKNHTELTEIAIPGTVIGIGSCAFFGCSNLRAIAHQDTITSIERGAFALCSSLTSFVIPSRVKQIADSTFSGCGALVSMALPKAVTCIGERAFKDCSSITSITNLETVTRIDKRAFQGCDSLQSIDIPDGLSKICEGTFFGCSSLQEIVIPDSVTHIDWLAFGRCVNLRSVDIPNNVIFIGNGVFKDCRQLTSIKVQKSLAKKYPHAFEEYENALNYKRRWP